MVGGTILVSFKLAFSLFQQEANCYFQKQNSKSDDLSHKSPFYHLEEEKTQFGKGFIVYNEWIRITRMKVAFRIKNQW
jgi:hypothetical protein